MPNFVYTYNSSAVTLTLLLLIICTARVGNKYWIVFIIFLHYIVIVLYFRNSWIVLHMLYKYVNNTFVIMEETNN